MVYASITTENIHRVAGDFREISFIRNPNNTGPVHRIYAFAVGDTLKENMKQHANLLPHTKHGITEAYYFMAKDSMQFEFSTIHEGLPKAVGKLCIAVARKDENGTISLTSYQNK